jgi:hypothetical protein
MTKQIRLKEKTLKIDYCGICPICNCDEGDLSCNLDAEDIEKDCPLEEGGES